MTKLMTYFDQNVSKMNICLVWFTAVVTTQKWLPNVFRNFEGYSFFVVKKYMDKMLKRVRQSFCTLKSEEHALAAFKTQTHIHSFFFMPFLTHTYNNTYIFSFTNKPFNYLSTHTHTHTFNLIPDPQRTPWPWRGRPFVLSSLWHQDPCLLGPDPASTSQSAFDNPQVLLRALLGDGPHLIESHRENVNTCTEWSLNTFLFFLKIPKIPFCSLKQLWYCHLMFSVKSGTEMEILWTQNTPLKDDEATKSLCIACYSTLR